LEGSIQIPQEPVVHTVTKLLIGEEGLAFSAALIALELGASLLAEEAVYKQVTITGDTFHLGDKVAPTVFTSDNTLPILVEVKGQLHKGKAEKTVSGEDVSTLRDAVQQ